MAALTAPPAAPTAPERPDGAQAPQIRDAGSPLRLFVCLLFGIPSGLVFSPLGAAGAPASVLGLCFLIWWLNARLVPRLGVSRSTQPIRIGLYAFGFSAGASYLAGALRPLASEEASSSTRGLLSVCAWAGILLVTADGLRTRESVDRLLRFVVGAGVFLAVIGLIEFFTGWNPANLVQIPGLRANTDVGDTIARANFTRVQGTAAHAIEFGVVLSMVLPLALHYAWFATDHRRRRWLGVLLIGFALPMTVSRSAMLGMVIVLAVMFLAWPPAWRWAAIRLLPVLAVLLKLLVPGLLGAIKGLFVNFNGDPSTQGRTDDYAAVGHYVEQSPFFGRGLSTFIPELYRTLDNAVLGWVLEAGLVGLVLLIGFLATAVAVALHIRTRARGDHETRDLAAALAAAILAAGFNFATFDALGFAICAGLLFLLIGAIGALWRLAPGDWEGMAGTLPRVRWTQRLRGPRASLGLLAQVAGAAIAIAVVLIPGVIRTEYSATASVLLLGPEQTGYDTNPYRYSPYLDIPSDIAQRLVMSPDTAAALRARGITGRYTVAAGIGSLKPMTDRVGRGPLIRIEARANTAESALRTRDAVIEELQVRWQRSQTAVGAPGTELIRATTASSSTFAVPQQGNRKHALVAAGALGFALGGSGWYLLGRLKRAYYRRHDRRQADQPSSGPVPPGPPPTRTPPTGPPASRPAPDPVITR